MRCLKVLALLLSLSLATAARAQISRYSNAKIVPIKGTGAEVGRVVGFKLKMVIHSEKPQHTRAWVGLVSSPDALGLGKGSPPFNIILARKALSDLRSRHWHQHWTVEDLKQGIPSEQEFTVLYKDNPKLVPGTKYQLAATFLEETGEPGHTFGAEWGAGYSEPMVELPK
jgi:hypothetical protein